jgi:hypothetical protein
MYQNVPRRLEDETSINSLQELLRDVQSTLRILYVDMYLQERIRGASGHRVSHRLAAFDPTDWAPGRHSETKSDKILKHANN